MNGNRIFIISEYICKSQNSTGYYWQSLINLAANIFESTTVLTVKGQSDNFEDISDEVTILPVSRNHNFQVQGIKRVIAQAVLSIKVFLKSLFLLKRGDIVFCGTNPAPFVFFAALLKKLKGIKWVLLVHDVFPENLAATNLISDKNILYKVTAFLFSWAYSQPDKIIVIGRDMEQLLLKKCKSELPTVFIPNWAEIDTSKLVPKNESSMLDDLNISNKIVIQFFGNIGSAQGISKLLSIIKQVDNDDICFIFAGSGGKVRELKEFIKASTKKNIFYIGKVPLSSKERVLQACDLSFVILEEGMLGLGVPSKTYFSLAANVPIIAIGEQGSELQYLTRENSVGKFFDIKKTSPIIEFLNSLSHENLKSMEFEPRQAYDSYYTKELILEKYRTVLNSIRNIK